MNIELHNLTADWACLGAGFNTDPATSLPDLERLLLRTARGLRLSPKMLAMAATWLGRFGHLVAEDRLAHLVTSELEEKYLPGLGLLLETARAAHPRPPLKQVLALCHSAKTPGPLFDQSRKSVAFTELARLRASPESRRWGCWADPVDLKFDALMGMRWLLGKHPEMQFRAEYFGDLRASVLAAVLHEPGARASELALQRAIGHSRSGIRDALLRLELAAHIERKPEGARSSIQWLPPLALVA